jgi:hypothetical protein
VSKQGNGKTVTAKYLEERLRRRSHGGSSRLSGKGIKQRLVSIMR